VVQVQLVQESMTRTAVKGLTWRILSSGLTITLALLLFDDLQVCARARLSPLLQLLQLRMRAGTRNIARYQLSCASRHCTQAQSALELGAIEFVSKFGLYFVHERLWALVTFVL
jgi:uncharacterized membrane protein